MNNKFDDVTDVVDEHVGHAEQVEQEQDAKLKSMLLQILKDEFGMDKNTSAANVGNMSVGNVGASNVSAKQLNKQVSKPSSSSGTTVNKALKSIMKDKGVTQEQMGKLLDKSTGQRYVSNTLRSENMNINIVISFCELLGYEVVLQPKKPGKRKDGEYVVCKGEMYSRRSGVKFLKKNKDEE